MMTKTLDINMNWTFNNGSVSLSGKNLEAMAQYFDQQHLTFVQKAILVHRKIVFMVLRYLIRICPVDTGRLRGSFTPFFDKYSNSSYSKWLADSSMAPSDRKTPKKGFSQTSVQEGKNEGEFVDSDMETTIMSNVFYAGYADNTTNYLAKTLVYGDNVYNKTFGQFLDAAATAGWIPDVDPNSEDEQGGV